MGTRLVRTLPSTEVGSGVVRVIVAGVDVLLARLPAGDVVAFAATCPHQGTDLRGAVLVDGCVQCPLHSYSYDARTGENVVPTRDIDPAELWKSAPGYLRVHPVEERDGWIWVGEEPKPPPPSYDPARERPPGAAPAPASTSQPDGVLRVRAGTTFELRLPTVPRPGFVWRVDAGGGLLAVVGERFEPGAPGHHVVHLSARAAGRSVVRCSYARPWDTEPAEVRTYEVVVEPN